MDGKLTAFASVQQHRFNASISLQDRKATGHFGTPSPISEFMAGMFSTFPKGNVRILDAGAGVGMLAAAICQRALSERTSRKFFFELWENDPKLIPLLEATMARCRADVRTAGHEMRFDVRVDDFVLANSPRPLFKRNADRLFDLAILNPPYFKVRRESPHAEAMNHVVHGQPNIYALFMAAAVDLLSPSGEMVAITPRSYFNGTYFKRFRKWFFDRMTARHIHVFESRSEAFKDSAVLQENVILFAKKGVAPKDVILTTSAGRKLDRVERCSVRYDRVIDDSNGDHVVRVPTSALEREVVTSIDSLPNRFRGLRIEISTGPVVTFRSTEWLRFERGGDTAPLLWMHNVRPFTTRFPRNNGKPAHIEVGEHSRKLLVPAKWYVLLKRFTSKEEKRRLVAGILKPGDSYSEWVGLENHLNYIYRRGSELTRSEAYGLAAYFNSALVDRYFRAISGNTQVNATEIRGMPIPDTLTLVRIGDAVEELRSKDPAAVEELVGGLIGLPHRLTKKLVEVAG